VATGAQRLDRVGRIAGRRRDLGGDVGFDLFEHGLEQRLLAAEVMVERAAADARLAQHRLDRSARVAIGDEETRPDRNQLATGRLPLLDLPAPGHLDIPTVGRYHHTDSRSVRS
jgi:hypothetical protein